MHQRRQILERLLGKLNLAFGYRVNAFDRELVGLTQRLNIAALRRPDRLDIERAKAKIGEHLGYVEIEERRASIGHGRIPGSEGLLCGAQSLGLYEVCLFQRQVLFRDAASGQLAFDGQASAGS
jgi:hypothetical protein